MYTDCKRIARPSPAYLYCKQRKAGRGLGNKATFFTHHVHKHMQMDWSESRFNDIQQKLKAFLKQAGFKVLQRTSYVTVKFLSTFTSILMLHFQESDISYVPCSGMTGENLVQPLAATTNTKWYKGPTLLDRIGILD